MPLASQRLFSYQIHQVHIADGFADDCEELIHRWLKSDLLTYETFCEIWKDMQFDTIFYGRTTGGEMAELTEELINIAKYYMVTNPDHFEESVAGLFLVYALINLQPYPGFASLRLVPGDVLAIKRIETVARDTRRYDVLYILGSVLVQGPVQYHAEARERGMEASIRKYLDGTTGIDRVGVRPKGVFYRQNEELDLLRELNNIERRYTDAKMNIPGSSHNLNYANEKLTYELDTSLKQVINGILEEGDEGNKKLTDHFSRVQAIKEKAMKQTVDSVRFLSSAADRTPEAKKHINNVKAEAEKKASKRPKQSSRRCTVGAHTYKSRGRRKIKRTRFSSTSSDSSIDLSSDTQEETESHSSTDDDVPLKNLSLDSIGQPASQIEIEIDRLPVLIRKDQDLFEIEIIDEMRSQPPEDTNKPTEVEITKYTIETAANEGTSKEEVEISKLEDKKTEKSHDKSKSETILKGERKSKDSKKKPVRKK